MLQLPGIPPAGGVMDITQSAPLVEKAKAIVVSRFSRVEGRRC